jgi:hypothetical protein
MFFHAAPLHNNKPFTWLGRLLRAPQRVGGRGSEGAYLSYTLLDPHAHAVTTYRGAAFWVAALSHSQSFKRCLPDLSKP